MNQDVLLSISYVLPLALLVWLWLDRRPGTAFKLLLTALLPLLYFLHWMGLQENRGWPSPQTLPLQFELLSADIVEPDPLKGVTGNIHLWVRPLVKPEKSVSGENSRGGIIPAGQTPRAYVLPYSRALHKKLFETKQRVAQGRSQMGLLYDEHAGGSGASLGNGRKLDFQDMPQRQLPPKR